MPRSEHARPGIRRAAFPRPPADRILAAVLDGADPPPLDPPALRAAVQSLIQENLAAYVHARLFASSPPRSTQVERLLESLRPARLEAAKRSLYLQVQLKKSLATLGKAGIAVMPFKGAELAHLAYPAPETRHCIDLDLWVEPSRIEAALAALAADGWREENLDPLVRAFHRERDYHVPLVDERKKLLLELHHRLYPDLPARAQREIWQHASPGELLGEPVQVPRATDRFILLCLHLATTGLKGAGKWLVDLAHLLTVAPPALRPNLDELIERARAWGQEVFLVVASCALKIRWNFAGLEPVERALGADLRGAERRLVHKLARRGADLSWREVVAARRLAGREASIPGRVFSSIWCHPGRVCLDLGVSSNSPWLPWHRLRHASRRVKLALASLR